MPELPEVETIVAGLAPRLLGRRFEDVEVLAPLVCKTSLRPLAGQRVSDVRRHGKNILIECAGGFLWVHLGMTGKLLLDACRTPYTRVVFHLDGGELLYDDVRMFGRLQWSAGVPERLAALGPDALTISAEQFVQRLRARRGNIKALLLNQRFLGGLGNIYADESLFRSGIHPRALAGRLSQRRARRLYAAIQDVLREAIAHGGSSISDYVDAWGAAGEFQRFHQVYGRQGMPCPVCGAAIRRIVIGQRGTHYCPRCQRS
ncbi:MAG: bifunctional DNA-formamidopyrimidine glycosylase/DNA-(apurinic or apyrimidinic site) lyase [Bryobacteraceae bacterium]|nr:bifunctional DNA-formamidopyrimidine glycosylase/DNA-(apurinic or apyrimidinic site) lyase [Bryobacteraceae bacterium]MDW8377295.1 bifunctional DNA-formamidopyrimidine glycosylase/DNA-(apurinic or apyrimidinic site) lyase [Bryobacterales bacterium]